ncbi:putative galactose oxidase/kelch, beta-propeller, F-box associated interaction [Arabidopsis thaliana]
MCWVNVLNPCTGEFLRFPSGPNPVDTSRYDNHRVIEGASWLAYYPGYWAMGFGKDKVNGTYKIVRMFYDTNQFEILDLTIGEWRTMPNPPPYYVQPNHHSAFVNGSIYWYDLVTGYKILALDLHTEQFRDSKTYKIRLLPGYLCPNYSMMNCIPITVSKQGNVYFHDSDKRLLKYNPKTHEVCCVAKHINVLFPFVENMIRLRHPKTTMTYPPGFQYADSWISKFCRRIELPILLSTTVVALVIFRFSSSSSRS